MYKTNAVKWPVLACSGTFLSSSSKQLYTGSTLQTLSRRSGCQHRRIPQLITSASISTAPLQKDCTGFIPTLQETRSIQHRNIPSTIQCLRPLSHTSPRPPSISHTPASSIPHRILACDSRQLHTQPSKQDKTGKKGHPRTKKVVTASKPGPSRAPGASISKTKDHSYTMQKESITESTSSTSSGLASVLTTESSMGLNNFRVLLHRGHRIAGSLPSSITPPLAALTHLFWHLDSSKNLDQLLPADWSALISWLTHHRDDSTQSQIHQLIMNNKKLASKCGTETITALTEARVRNVLGSDSISSLSLSARLEPSKINAAATIGTTAVLDIIQDTISLMKELDIPRSKGLYDLYLSNAVLEHRWFRGIGVWNAVTSAQERVHLPPPSIIFRAQVVRCHLQLGNSAAASELLQSIFDQTSWTDLNSLTVYDGRSIQAGVGGLGEAEIEQQQSGTMENRTEYVKQRQSQASRAIHTLQKTTIPIATSDSTAVGEVQSQNGMQNWKTEVYPSLIEAICHGEKDNSGATLAVDLASELLQQGHLLDKTRFALLVQYIGAATTSEQAESFMKGWVNTVKATPFSLLPSGANKDATDMDTGSVPATSKDVLRKQKRTAVSTAKSFAEVGLQEIVRQATSTQDYPRAFTVFQEMSGQGFSLYSDTSDKLLMGLAKVGDLRSAVSVLEISLQHKRVPSIEAVNALLQGLIRNDWLDESVSIFRDLTENYEVRPSKESYRHLLHLTSSYGQLAMTQRLLSALKGLGVERDGAIYRDLMKCYIRSDSLTGAIKVFENMDGAGISTTIQHINVLLEGAVRQSTPSTVIRILEIMSSKKIKPDAETWNILLVGAFVAKDKELALGFFQELAQSLVERSYYKADATFRASRHPVTFNLLVNDYADRFGIGAALTLLDQAVEAKFPAMLTQNVYRDLLEKSAQQGNGRAGYRVYQLLRQWEQRSGTSGSPQLNSKSGTSDPQITATGSSGVITLPTTRLHPLSAFSATPTSPSARAPSLGKLYCGVMEQLDKEGLLELGNEMATDLILSGVELDQDLVTHAIRLYARSGELAAAFGLFMKMGRAYGVEPSKEMVLSLMDAARAYQLIPGLDEGGGASSTSTSSTKWDDTSVQQWTRILRVSMGHFGLQ